MRVELLVNSWRRPEKDEDGNRILTRYRRGDVIDVTNSEAKALCRDLPLVGPIAKEAKAESRSSEGEQARSSEGSGSAQAKK